MNTIEESWAELDGEPIFHPLDYLFESIAVVEPRRNNFIAGVNENAAVVEPRRVAGIDENESNDAFLTRIRREMDEERRVFIEEERRAATQVDQKKYMDVFPNGWKNGAGPNPYENISKPIRPMTKEEEKKVIYLRMNFR